MVGVLELGDLFCWDANLSKDLKLCGRLSLLSLGLTLFDLPLESASGRVNWHAGTVEREGE